MSNSSISPANIDTNKTSRQQLLYWEDKGVFVAHGAGTTYTSTDGITWTENSEIHWATNTYLTAEDEYLILAGGSSDSALNAQDNLTTKQYSDNKFLLSSTAYIPVSIAATPKDENGDIYVLTIGKNYSFYAKMTPNVGEKCSWELIKSPSGGTIPSAFDDMIYAEGAGQFLAVNNQKLHTIVNGDTFREYELKAGTTVTGIGASDKYIAAGLSDGTILYTQNAPITEETVWNTIPVAEGKTACTEPIKNIEFADNGEDFVALSDKHIYLGDTISYIENTEYEYVPEYRTISDPYVTGEAQENPFVGVKLIGGAYSPTLDTYVVYGTDTATSESKIFTSNDGCVTWTPYTTDSRHTLSNLKNGAVWWESQGMFVIAGYNTDNIGVLYTSADGYNWTAKGNADTGYVKGAEIAVGGTSLYTTNGSKQFYKYSALSKDSMTNVILTEIKAPDGSDATLENNYALTSISVSDSDDPAVFLAGQFLGVTRNNDSEEAEETDKWIMLSNIGNGDIIDSVYSANSDQFIVLVDKNVRTSIIKKDGSSVDQGPIISDGVVLNGVDTNGSDFMFTCDDGKIYTAPDTADFSKDKSPLTEISSIKGDNNTMPVTNVFAAGDKFILTVSDGTDSDVLVAAKNASSGKYEYKAVSDGIGGGTFEPGGTVKVNVDVDNQMPEACSFTMIAAIYDPDGRLIQSVTADRTVSEYTSQTETMDVAIGEEVPDGSSMRLFVWNNMQEMTPLTNVTVPF